MEAGRGQRLLELGEIFVGDTMTRHRIKFAFRLEVRDIAGNVGVERSGQSQSISGEIAADGKLQEC